MAKILDLVGSIFGSLKVISRNDNDEHGRTHWQCVCECGRRTNVRSDNLKSGRVTTCGCKIGRGTKPIARYRVWIAEWSYVNKDHLGYWARIYDAQTREELYRVEPTVTKRKQPGHYCFRKVLPLLGLTLDDAKYIELDISSGYDAISLRRSYDDFVMDHPLHPEQTMADALDELIQQQNNKSLA